MNTVQKNSILRVKRSMNVVRDVVGNREKLRNPKNRGAIKSWYLEIVKKKKRKRVKKGTDGDKANEEVEGETKTKLKIAKKEEVKKGRNLKKANGRERKMKS